MSDKARAAKRARDRARYDTEAYRRWNADRMQLYRLGPYGTAENLRRLGASIDRDENILASLKLTFGPVGA